MKCVECPYFYDDNFYKYLSKGLEKVADLPMKDFIKERDRLMTLYGELDPQCNYHYNDGYAPCETEKA